MDLLLDLGHTRLKWAWWEAGQVAGRGAVSWRNESPAALCAQLWANDQTVPARVALAAVAHGELIPVLEECIARRFGRPVRHLRPAATGGGVTNGYRNPLQLGVDRWAAMLGVWRLAPGAAALVADCGSAVTVDALDVRGRHLGGIIAPGLALGAEAFFNRTGRTGEAGARARQDGCAVATAEAVASGALFAAAGAIALMRARVVDLGASPTLWLTGGDAGTVVAMLDGPVRMAADLVFEGMAVMLELEQ